MNRHYTQKKAAPMQDGYQKNTNPDNTTNLAATKPAKRLSQLERFLLLMQQGSASTLNAERHVGTTRVANLATTARKRFGLELPCRIVSNLKPDGSNGTYGIYEPTEADKKRIQEIVESLQCGY